jgi:hypothetical protein
MIWQCADCGHQLVTTRRPAACRFCGPDVEFFVANATKQAGLGSKSAGHPGVWARLVPAPARGR